MIQSTFAFLLLAIGFASLALQRLYSSIPTHELKRLAVRHDQLAAQLYKAAAYGSSLRLLLWMIAGLSLAGAFVLAAGALPDGLAFGLVALSLGMGFVGLLSMRLTVRSAQFTGHAAPVVAWILQYIHPVLDRIAGLTYTRRERIHHSRLYEKEDLAALLARQKDQPDNRIDPEELSLAERALVFSDKQAADIVMPRAYIRTIDANDTIGPILLGELHESGQSSFLVYKDRPEQVVGTLFMRDAIQAKQGGRVEELMRKDLVYVHEDFNLRQVLDAFLKTRQYLIVVINGFQEMIGVITLDNFLRELFGELPAEAPVSYEDRASVAAYQPTLQAPNMTEESAPAEPTAEGPSSEAPEVIK